MLRVIKFDGGIIYFPVPHLTFIKGFDCNEILKVEEFVNAFEGVKDITSVEHFKTCTNDINLLKIKKFQFPINDIVSICDETLLDSLHKNFLMLYFICINCLDTKKEHYNILLAFFEGDTFISENLSENIIEFLKILNNEISTGEIAGKFTKVLENPQLPTIIHDLLYAIILCSKSGNPESLMKEANDEICQFEKSTIKKYIDIAKTKLQSKEVKDLLDIATNFNDMDITKMSSLLSLVSDLDMSNFDLNNLLKVLN